MEWSDEGVILGVRPHGETGAVLELFTRAHGRHLGLVHGGRSRKLRPVLQTGNHVDATWKARLADNLGHFTLELRKGFAAGVMDDAAALAALTSIAALTRLLPERDPHPNLYEVTLFVLGFLDERAVWPALVVRWELALLEELGFGLDLASCAATGKTTDLVYVSPKSGRAVSAEAGEPYKDRLLALPAFLRAGATGAVTEEDLRAGFALTGHFLDARVLRPRDMADARRARPPAVVSWADSSALMAVDLPTDGAPHAGNAFQRHLAQPAGRDPGSARPPLRHAVGELGPGLRSRTAAAAGDGVPAGPAMLPIGFFFGVAMGSAWQRGHASPGPRSSSSSPRCMPGAPRSTPPSGCSAIPATTRTSWLPACARVRSARG